MGKASYAPQNKSELARALEVPSQQRAELRELIEELAEEGELVRLKKGTFALKKPVRDLVPGLIRILKSGKVLFRPDDPVKMSEQLGAGFEPVSEMVVPSHALMSAMDGDRVAAKVEFTMPKGWRKRRKGRPSLDDMLLKIRIEQILERGSKKWVGVYRAGRAYGQVRGDGVSSPPLIEVSERPELEVQPGQLVVVTPVEWNEGRASAKGTICEVLGWPDSPGVDIEVIVRKYQLETVFPDDALQEAALLADGLDPETLKGREDWTAVPIMSIDPEGARDFDDAIHVQAGGEGWQLAVHIADVSHYVKPGSALDREAMKRGNSTYLPDRVLPMLPSRLSNDLCSLRAGAIRLTKACVMQFNAKGKVVKVRFTDAYIKNERQITYPEAYGKMMGQGTDGESVMLREAWKLASLLRRNRMKEGALDLDFPEIRVILDDEGVPVKVIADEYDESHQLIEEFMLAANESVARALKDAARPAIYRVHEDPDEAKLKEFGELSKYYGHPVHDLQQRDNLVRLLESIKGSPDEQMLKLALLRSMMRARYDTEPLGHYGLAKVNYCHFTSPIRRYADLEVHRSLNGLMGHSADKGKWKADVAHLQEIAVHISETERISSNAERDAHRMKLFEWLAGQVDAENPVVHEAHVTEVRHYGLLVEIPKLQLKGLIKPSGFSRGKWYHEGFAERWSRSDGSSIRVGTKLPVIPVDVDTEKQWIDFAIQKY